MSEEVLEEQTPGALMRSRRRLENAVYPSTVLLAFGHLGCLHPIGRPFAPVVIALSVIVAVSLWLGGRSEEFKIPFVLCNLYAAKLALVPILQSQQLWLVWSILIPLAAFTIALKSVPEKNEWRGHEKTWGGLMATSTFLLLCPL